MAVAPDGAQAVQAAARDPFDLVLDEQRFLQAGMDGYVSKPPDFDRLARLMRGIHRGR